MPQQSNASICKPFAEKSRSEKNLRVMPGIVTGHLSNALDMWRRDRLVLGLYLLATIVMTFPLAFRLGGAWLGTRDVDTYVHMWNAWWFGQLLFGGQRPYFTYELFHPVGLDLTFNSFSWTHAALSWLLQYVVNRVTANNLTILWAVFGTAYGGYLLTRSMVEHRAAAWLGGAVYSFAPYHIAHSGGHPDLVHLAALPVTVLLFIRALTTDSMKAALGAALLFGITALASLYIADFTGLTLVLLFIPLAVERQRWRKKAFWRAVIAFGVASTVLLTLRVWPILRDPGALGTAIGQKYDAAHSSTELLSYVVPRNPVFQTMVADVTAGYRSKMSGRWPAYLGVIPLMLVPVALTWRKHLLRTWTWLIIGLFFVSLSQGSTYRVANEAHQYAVKLPTHVLTSLAPIRAVARPDYFVIGVLLPLSVCVAHGMERLLALLHNRRAMKIGLVVVLGGLLLFDYWLGPYAGTDLAWVNSPLYEQLAQEDDDFAMVQLPMGRFHAKIYMYLQTIHEKPIVEGVSSRMPPDAYRYYDDNLLLTLWKENKPLNCETVSNEEMQAAAEALLADGFRYVIVHHSIVRNPDELLPYFGNVSAFYEDETLTAYLLESFLEHPPCS